MVDNQENLMMLFVYSKRPPNCKFSKVSISKHDKVKKSPGESATRFWESNFGLDCVYSPESFSYELVKNAIFFFDAAIFKAQAAYQSAQKFVETRGKVSREYIFFV